MATVRPEPGKNPDKKDHRADVVKAALLAAGSIVAAIATIVRVSDPQAANQGTVQYAIAVVGVIALAVAAVYVLRRDGRGRRRKR